MHANPKIIEKKHLSIDVEQIISFEFSAFCVLVLVWWHYFGSRSTLLFREERVSAWKSLVWLTISKALVRSIVLGECAE